MLFDIHGGLVMRSWEDKERWSAVLRTVSSPYMPMGGKTIPPGGKFMHYRPPGIFGRQRRPKFFLGLCSQPTPPGKILTPGPLGMYDLYHPVSRSRKNSFVEKYLGVRRFSQFFVSASLPPWLGATTPPPFFNYPLNRNIQKLFTFSFPPKYGHSGKTKQSLYFNKCHLICVPLFPLAFPTVSFW